MPKVCALLWAAGIPDKQHCCPPPVCALAYQTKAGTGTLCGLDEYTTPSSPPKRYRLQTAGGSYRKCQNSDLSGQNQVLSGTCRYDALTCVATNTQISTVNGGPNANDCNAGPLMAVNALSCNRFSPEPNAIVSVQRILFTYTGPGNLGTGTETGVITGSLSFEDTEDDAINRQLPGIALWTSCSPSTPADCSSYKVLRVAGVFSFGFRLCQVQVSAAGTTPGVIYNTTINLQRRLQGTSDPFVAFATLSWQFVGPAAPATSYTGPWIAVPATSGYEVAATSCAILAA